MKKILLLFTLLFIVYSAKSQTYLISAGGTVTACGEYFYDSGNSGGNYSANENFTMTFHSNNGTNTHIRMSFMTFDVEPGDTLIVYNGSNIGANVIGKYNNNNIPPAFVAATISGNGDLTFQFKSNGTINNAGWGAAFVCTQACQEIKSLYNTVLTVPHPNDSNYIDICIGNPITFAAKGSGAAFPESGILYPQDSTNCTFIWDFGDGITDTGQIVSHTYTLVRGYDIGLTIYDSRGCTNTNYLGGRVRISQSPFAEINPIPDLCSSTDTTFITLGYNASSIVVIQPVTSVQSASEKFDSTLFIPDGPNCPTQCYNTFVTFMAFAQNATITAASDILSICVNMEHSFTGDLGFRIICPNGQSVQLDPNTHSGGAYMGEPYGGSSHATYDNGCDPSNNPYGVGWTYCWSQFYPQHGTLDALSNGGGTIDSTNTITNTNYITPNNSLSGLIGCPLNGTWNIEICDDYGIDNGYIFWWELNLDPSLLPVGWGYQVPIDTVTWTGSFFSIINDSTIRVIPDSGGTYQYTVTVTDIFGCSYDTTLSIQVVQTPHPDLGNDTTLCGNNINFILDAGAANAYAWSTGNTNQTQSVTSTGYYIVEVGNFNSAQTISCNSKDTIYVKVLAQPAIVDLGPDICSTVPVTLDAQNAGGVFDYQWSTGATTQTIVVNTTGTYTVSVAEEFGYNCETVGSKNVTIIPEPVIEIGPDSTICSFNYFSMTVKDQNGYLDQYPYTYLWTTNPGSPLNGLTLRDVEFGCLTPGVSYTVTAAVTGCSTVTDTRVITAKDCKLELYNIITPNKDPLNQNEYFAIKGIENFPNSKMQIYNRWGKKIYESNNYDCHPLDGGGYAGSNCWDGANCADGVYYYVLTVNYGKSEGCVDEVNYQGTITVIR